MDKSSSDIPIDVQRLREALPARDDSYWELWAAAAGARGAVERVSSAISREQLDLGVVGDAIAPSFVHERVESLSAYSVRLLIEVARSWRPLAELSGNSFVVLIPSRVGLALSGDGQPPNFDDLVAAINVGLAQDPGDGALHMLAPLTAAQSHQGAAESIWHRTLSPTPPPPRPLGEIDTQPPINPAIQRSEPCHPYLLFACTR